MRLNQLELWIPNIVQSGFSGSINKFSQYAKTFHIEHKVENYNIVHFRAHDRQVDVY